MSSFNGDTHPSMTSPNDSTMSAVAIQGGKGAASALHLTHVPKPEPRPNEILIRVHAAGVNRPDVFQRQGFYPPPPGASATLGLEVAGEVVSASGRWAIGDRVCALLGGGGYAEYATCDARHALPIPARLGFTEAAGLMETAVTVYANVFDQGHLKPGDTFMVHGATSGIGIAAVQMAKAAGARVIATGRGADKARAAESFGADVAVDTTVEDFATVAAAQGGVDVILDMVGGAFFAGNLDALRPGGVIVFIASLGGAEVTIPVMKIMAKRAVITGSTLRSRDADEKARLIEGVERVVWPWIEAGKLRPQTDRVFPLAQAAEAHAWLEQGSHVGKVILAVG